jgi:CHAD domain-containing protein
MAELGTVLAEMAALSARRVMERERRFWEKPNLQRTHALSTGLTRFLAVDFLTRHTFSVKLIHRRKSGVLALRKRLGRVRDLQENRKKLKEPSTGDALRKAMITWSEAELKTAMGVFSQALKGFSLRPFESQQKACTIRKELTGSPRIPLAELRQHLLARVLVYEAPAISGEDDCALHKLRVRFKAYRYTIDLLPPDMSGADAPLLAQLKGFQDLLGEAHDWLVLEQLFEEFRPGHPLPDWITAPYANTHRRARHRAKRLLPQLLAWENSGRALSP